ncbi:unnamed protein product [Arabidopsis thaliana]|uniref:(thale cress) hypothetical protein n=1 Tax=Arabidopsis thaliana TaxID=3702 RepID=A0A7G2EBN4_ARATH|nr:unnamed protein product [Arabidopsis thaliana]
MNPSYPTRSLDSSAKRPNSLPMTRTFLAAEARYIIASFGLFEGGSCSIEIPKRSVNDLQRDWLDARDETSHFEEEARTSTNNLEELNLKYQSLVKFMERDLAKSATKARKGVKGRCSTPYAEVESWEAKGKIKLSCKLSSMEW